MEHGEEARPAVVVTRAEQSEPTPVPCWDALRANAIGSLWGRSAAEPRIGHGALWALRADTAR